MLRDKEAKGATKNVEVIYPGIKHSIWFSIDWTSILEMNKKNYQVICVLKKRTIKISCSEQNITINNAQKFRL
jgi:hypothetical protein